MTKVLVTGATGQDAYYLMQKLVHQGFEVTGMMRPGDPARAEHLKEIPFLRLVQGDLCDYPSLLSITDTIRPDVVINTAGLTSPTVCWGVPDMTVDVNGLGPCRLLSAYPNMDAKFIQFGSIAEFGPYGASKLYAERMYDDYRAQGLQTTTIRFAGHHSPRRNLQFFSRRVSYYAAKIKLGQQDSLSLGPLLRSQDWGYAPEFMDAVIETLDLAPGTYSVGTGDPVSLEQYVKYTFDAVGLNYRDHVKAGDYEVQPTDVAVLSVKPDHRLFWRPKTSVPELARIMVEADLERLG